MAGGVDVLELENPSLHLLRAARRVDGLVVGAGHVQTVEQAEAAVQGGAHFATAPATNMEVVHACRELELPFFPGVATPSEIERLALLGVRTQRLFPAEPLGGQALLAAVAAIYPDVASSPPAASARSCCAGTCRSPPSWPSRRAAWCAATCCAAHNYERVEWLARDVQRARRLIDVPTPVLRHAPRVAGPGIAALGAALALSPYLWLGAAWRGMGFSVSFVPFHLWRWAPFALLAVVAGAFDRRIGAGRGALPCAGTVGAVLLTQSLDASDSALGLALPGLLILGVAAAWGVAAHGRRPTVSPPLAVGLVALVAAVIFAGRLLAVGELDRVQTFLVIGTSIVVEALPFVLLGAGVSAAIEVFVPERWFAAIARLPLAAAGAGRRARRAGDAGLRVRVRPGGAAADRPRRAPRGGHRVHARGAGHQPGRAAFHRGRLPRPRRAGDGRRARLARPASWRWWPAR